MVGPTKKKFKICKFQWWHRIPHINVYTYVLVLMCCKDKSLKLIFYSELLHDIRDRTLFFILYQKSKPTSACFSICRIVFPTYPTLGKVIIRSQSIPTCIINLENVIFVVSFSSPTPCSWVCHQCNKGRLLNRALQYNF